MNANTIIARAMLTAAVAVFYCAWLWGAGALWRGTSGLTFFITAFLYLPPATWVFYAAGMGIEWAEHDKRLPPTSAYIAKLLWPLAAAHNLLNNAFPMTVLFLDTPRELATTKRLNRYVDGPAGRRRDMALFVREQLLNWADRRGTHT